MSGQYDAKGNMTVDGKVFTKVVKDAIIGGISGGAGGTVQNTFIKKATKAESFETHKDAVISEIKHENRIYGIPNGRNVSKSADNIIKSEKVCNR